MALVLFLHFLNLLERAAVPPRKALGSRIHSTYVLISNPEQEEQPGSWYAPFANWYSILLSVILGL